MSNRYVLSIWFGVACVLAGSALSFGQSGRSTAPPQTQSASGAKTEVPRHLLYRHLFGHINQLEQRAEELDRQARDASEVREYYRRRLRLTSQESAILKRVAAQTEELLRAQDAKAQAVITEFRAKFPKGSLSSAAEVPQPPAALKGLQDDRDALIVRQITALQAALGPDTFFKLDQFVQNSFAPNVTVTKLVGPPRQHNPSTQPPVPPFVRIP
jgi:hypothetical protein